MISKRIFGHILLATLLSPLNQIKAQENSCITTFSKEIPNGLIASTAELEALSDEFKEYLKSSDLEVRFFNCDEDKTFKINSELSKIINKEIVLHNYSSSNSSCRLKFNNKDKMIEARNLRQTNAFINELSSINASNITEQSRYNAELRDFVLKNQKYIKNDCTNQYIFLFTAANNFAKTRQCSVGKRYLAAAASILEKSNLTAVSDKEEGRLNNIRNSLNSCSPKIEPKQPVRIEPKQPIESEQEPSKGPENINDEPLLPNSRSYIIQTLQNQINILQETVANLNSEIVDLKGKLELNDLEIKRLDNIANEASKNNENLIKEKEQIAISYEEKVSELESDIFDLLIQDAEKNSEITDLKVDIRGLNNVIGGLNDQIGELKEENIKLKKQLRDESIFEPIMQIFKLKNLWYLLSIPFLLIGLILYNRTQEEKALEIEKKHL